jgi:hypothetical protein
MQRPDPFGVKIGHAGNIHIRRKQVSARSGPVTIGGWMRCANRE